MRRLRRFAAPLLGFALIGAGWASTASAQEDAADRLVLRAVDSRDAENVKAVVSWSGDAGALSDLQLEENGDEVDVNLATAADAGIRNDVIFVVDSSTSTDADALLNNVEEALGDFIGQIPAGMRVSVITAGAAGQVLQPLTTDSTKLATAVTDLTPGGEGGIFSAITQAGGRLEAAGSVGTIVLFTDGAPNETTASSAAEGALEESGAVLHVIGLDHEDFDQGTLRSLAEESGGTFSVTDDPLSIGDRLSSLRTELSQMAVATFTSSGTEGVQDLAVKVGDVTTRGSFVAGGNQVGPQRLVPRPGVEPSGPSFLRGDTGKTLGYLGVAVAGVLAAFAIISLFVRDDTALTTALRPYSDSYVAEEDELEGGDSQALAQTAFLRRAVEATEQFAERQGFLTRVERQLEKADLPLRAGEAMFFYLAGVLLALILTFGLTRNALGTLVIGLFVVLGPPAVLNFLAARKKREFEGLLPDTLQLLSSTLRAGYSMMQGVEAVSQEAAEPMGKELRRVVTEARLGRPLEEALDGIAERMDSADFGWAVMAIRIQREVGGNLSELLMTVAETMTQRERLRRDINSLTAEGRMSAYVLLALPVGLGLFLYVNNRDYIGKLFDTGTGQVMLGAAILGMVSGYFWMMKIIKIEI